MSADRARLQAVAALGKVLPAKGQGASLREVLGEFRTGLGAADRGLMTDIVYGVCRHQRLLGHWLDAQLARPIRASAWPVRLAALAGLYELWFTQRPAHAVVNGWPDVCRGLKAPWAAGLINALLRKATRLESPPGEGLAPEVRWSLPDWLWARLLSAWPDQAATLAQTLAGPAPLTVRLRPGTSGRTEQVLRESGLHVSACGLAPFARTLSPARPAAELPGFREGLFAVQDEAAQLPAALVQVPPGGRVLDACAAPGGKTAQLADLLPDAGIVALDVDPRRLRRVEENLGRLHLRALPVVGDAAAPESWWDGQPFDAVLLDAPCSATGILRRQPDVKWHRRPSDMMALCGLQARMLDAIWPLVRRGGMLVYATCSILPEENAAQIAAFLLRHGDAEEDTPETAGAVPGPAGRQLFPVPGGHDGFYFARLRKR